MDGGQPARPITWVGSSRIDLERFPQPVRRDMGKALYAAQRGDTDPAAKPLSGFEMAKKSTTIAHEESSGNAFADLGLRHPEQELL